MNSHEKKFPFKTYQRFVLRATKNRLVNVEQTTNKSRSGPMMTGNEYHWLFFDRIQIVFNGWFRPHKQSDLKI
jgi:hypothetical protein